MQIFDTTPHRRLRAPHGAYRTPIEFELSAPTVAAGALATAIALLTLFALAVPPSGPAGRRLAEWPGAYVRVQVPVLPGSSRMEDLCLPSITLMIPPVVGTFVAILGFAAGRKGRLAIGPAIGLVACAVAMACWWLSSLGLPTALGWRGVPFP